MPRFLSTKISANHCPKPLSHDQLVFFTHSIGRRPLKLNPGHKGLMPEAARIFVTLKAGPASSEGNKDNYGTAKVTTDLAPLGLKVTVMVVPLTFLSNFVISIFADVPWPKIIVSGS